MPIRKGSTYDKMQRAGQKVSVAGQNSLRNKSAKKETSIERFRKMRIEKIVPELGLLNKRELDKLEADVFSLLKVVRLDPKPREGLAQKLTGIRFLIATEKNKRK